LKHKTNYKSNCTRSAVIQICARGDIQKSGFSDPFKRLKVNTRFVFFKSIFSKHANISAHGFHVVTAPPVVPNDGRNRDFAVRPTNTRSTLRYVYGFVWRTGSRARKSTRSPPRGHIFRRTNLYAYTYTTRTTAVTGTKRGGAPAAQRAKRDDCITCTFFCTGRIINA